MNDTTEQILAEALHRLRPALTKRARAIVSNRSDVEDVVQESAARAWHARARLRPDVDPAPWLKTIVTRVAIDFARKERPVTPLGEEIPGRHHPSAEDHLMRSERLAALSSATTRLATEQQRVLVLHDVVGFTSNEIAHLDCIPRSTVRTRLRRARRSVRDRLMESST